MSGGKTEKIAARAAGEKLYQTEVQYQSDPVFEIDAGLPAGAVDLLDQYPPRWSQPTGYLRVSTDAQTLSVDAQRARLTAWCVERHLALTAVYEDIGVSGGAALDKRPGLMAAIETLVQCQ